MHTKETLQQKIETLTQRLHQKRFQYIAKQSQDLQLLQQSEQEIVTDIKENQDALNELLKQPKPDTAQTAKT